MRYVSTRGGVSGLSFCDAVMMGLASDGGLLVPEKIPDISDSLADLQGLEYVDIARRIMAYFIDDIPEDELGELIDRSYASFDDPLVTPLREVGDRYVLELFHGPTLAFKDVALQFLGNVFEYILADRGGRLNIVGATSGDTGSAAIAGVRGKQNINIFIMFPEGRTSELQEKQMTTVLDDNVQNISVEGSFDDCQSILKAVFNDLPFKEAHQLGAVNSVNWARVLAQVVYYFSAYVQLGLPKAFEVAVPTGNFGNIFAGYIARKMGLPITRLILATNQNDILHRFFTSGRYERGEVHFSHSPAMDIQVASNFERYLYFEFGENSRKVEDFMEAFMVSGVATIPFNTLNFDPTFATGAVSDDETLLTISEVYRDDNYLVDPHTAVGIRVGEEKRSGNVPLVCMATAHPAKFEDVMAKVLPDEDISHPTLSALKDAPTRKTVLPAEVETVKKFIHDFNDPVT
ncbi:MAG: threonine synthase [Gammaproteobacteria bacterium]|jgi:threonine synthase|nr:threonine synthase [Gammaproteobacteria bacterium]MBT4494640.1 threonine synthase [Gammaproteobacteria bacterium]MBT7370898.1 threonine synthase [Gammaproteobacteria bacterium]